VNVRMGRAVAVTAVLSLALGVTACGGAAGPEEGGLTVGLLLPGNSISRFEHFDRPLIEKRIKELCDDCTMEYANAAESVAAQRQQVDSMITRGAGVIILDVVDPKATRPSVEAAHRAGIPVVAYDRLAEGPISGYVAFDGTQVGRLQGEALLEAMGDRPGGDQIVMMNGATTDPNSDWFRRGAESVLKGRVRIGESYDTVEGRAENANANMSGAIAALGTDRIDGVLAANDHLATGVISALRAAKIDPLPPVTGQDASLEGVRHVVEGKQYMTVHKPFKREADAAAAMAVTLGRGESLGSIAETTVDSPTDENIPAVLLDPVPVKAGNIRETVVQGGMYTTNQICTPRLRSACERAGLIR
jgi:D-xylose transport system substrate-binding protein